MLARFAEPASRIVVSDQGDRAILVARRGEVCRLSRLDLVARRVRTWCDARIDQFASDFDGMTWFVARGGALYAVDATAARFEHLWKVDEVGAVVRQVRRSPISLSAWFEWLPPKTASLRAASLKAPPVKPRPSEIWTYDLPSLMLRRRQPVEDHGRLMSAAIGAEGDLAGWMAGDEVEPDTPQRIRAWCLRQNGQRDDLPDVPAGVVDMDTSIEPPSLTTEWALFPVRQGARPALYLLDMTALRVRARIVLEGEVESIRARFQAERLIVFDGCGRVLAISLASGAVLREYRLT
jgi:hypothetical protein